ncbi:hypothetical protein [Geminicoccus harenae]|nr:hypothetical protein [Geminicoccus harenae]
MTAGAAVTPEHCRRYSTGVSDKEWTLLAPLLEKHADMAEAADR